MYRGDNPFNFSRRNYKRVVVTRQLHETTSLGKTTDLEKLGNFTSWTKGRKLRKSVSVAGQDIMETKNAFSVVIASAAQRIFNFGKIKDSKERCVQCSNAEREPSERDEEAQWRVVGFVCQKVC